MQSISFRCVNCRSTNMTTYPVKSDLTPAQLGQKNRDDPPIAWVDTCMDMWVGFRKCRNCSVWNVVVFCGWYFNPDAFSYYPLKLHDQQGIISTSVASWVVDQAVKKGFKVPKALKDARNA